MRWWYMRGIMHRRILCSFSKSEMGVLFLALFSLCYLLPSTSYTWKKNGMVIHTCEWIESNPLMKEEAIVHRIRGFVFFLNPRWVQLCLHCFIYVVCFLLLLLFLCALTQVGLYLFFNFHLFSFLLWFMFFFYWIPRWVLSLFCEGAPFTAKSPLTFCSYNETVCCDAKEDLGLGKRFKDMNVSDPVCASLLKSILCAVICAYQMIQLLVLKLLE